MVTCALCDGNGQFLDYSKLLIRSAFKKNNMTVSISAYTDSEHFVRDINDGVRFDVVFLDIEMPKYNGIELVNILHQKTSGCLIVFLTSYTEFAVDAFELEVFRFIPKNEISQRIDKCISDLISRIRVQKEHSYVIQKNNTVEKLLYCDIKYVQKVGKYVNFVCTNGNEARVRKTLNEVLSALDKASFIPIDRGIFVNIAQISRLTECGVIFYDGETLPVSRTNVYRVKKILTDLWGEIV